MGDNAKTLRAYENGVQAYIDGSPKEVPAPIKKWIDLMLSQLPKDARILEIGTAHGRDADYIESKGHKVERTDAVEGFVKLQRSKGHEARVLNALTDELGGPYDLIFADAVFLHFSPEELKEVLNKSLRSLDPNGILAFLIKEGKGSEWSKIKIGSPRFFQYWDIEGMEALLLETGFELNWSRRFTGTYDGVPRLQFIAKPKVERG